jgi:DNA-binding transcriptional LysR family regulator
MELRQITEFLTVLECGSLGDAARRLKISQPNLTREIKLLEKAVGGALFVRSPKGMQPTALAHAFEPRARVIAGEVNRAERELDAYRGARTGKIVLAAGPVFAHAIFPTALARFRRSYPGVQVSVIDAQARDTLPLVAAGRVDYAFHSSEHWRRFPELTSELLFTKEPVLIVGRADHPLVLPRRPSLEQLANANWVLPAAPNYTRDRLDEIFIRAGLPPLRPVVEVSSAAFATEHVRHGGCLTLYARILAREELASGRFKTVWLPQLKWTFNIRVIMRRGVPLPPAAARLLAEVRKVCDEQRATPSSQRQK